MMPSIGLPPSALEAGLLGAITSKEKLVRVQVAGVEHSDFGVWPGVYKFICDYADKYNGVPTDQAIKAQWEDWNPPMGDFEYWLGEFIKRSISLKAEKIIRDHLKALETSPDVTIPELITKLSTVQYSNNSHIVATDTSIDDRLQKYYHRMKIWEENKGKFIWGIPTGLDIINKTQQGWMDGELIGFYARPTVGKTWMLVREAVNAWAHGYRILLVSPEVSAKHVALRIDVFLAAALGLQLSHKKIFIGDPSQAQAYEKVTEIVKQSERWWTVDSLQGRPLGLKDIRSLAHQFEPDMILIDGVLLLEDDKRAKEGWQKMDNICYGLKNFATADDLVIMMSHQAVNLNKGRKQVGAHGRGDDWVMPTLNDASGGEAFVRACTTIFTMAPDIKHSNLRWYSIRKSRERDFDEWKPRYGLGWDVDKGHIEDFSRYGEDMAVIEEKLKDFE